LLLTQGERAREATASLHFASDTLWLAPLVDGSKHQLHTALQLHGISLQKVSVGPIADTEDKAKPKTNHTILDLHV